MTVFENTFFILAQGGGRLSSKDILSTLCTDFVQICFGQHAATEAKIWPQVFVVSRFAILQKLEHPCVTQDLDPPGGGGGLAYIYIYIYMLPEFKHQIAMTSRSIIEHDITCCP